MQVNTSRPSFGLACWRDRPERMTVAHQHDDIEFHFSPADVDYRVDGVVHRLPAGRLAAFWAARPHQLIDDDPPEWVHWLTVPLGQLLSLGVRPAITAPLLRGEVLMLDDDPLSPAASARLIQWSRDLASGEAGARRTMLLELEAFLRRARPTALGASGATSAPEARGRELAGMMAEYIAAHSAEPVDVADVARLVHVHPRYAMAVFKREVGTTIGQYLTQCRVAQAQRLLLTSSIPVRDVAATAGFTSLSQFYESFGRACGISPAAYRREHAG